MSISLKANAAGTQGEILLNGTPLVTLPLGNYANDAAAAAAGVPIGGLYHTSGTVKVRIA